MCLVAFIEVEGRPPKKMPKKWAFDIYYFIPLERRPKCEDDRMYLDLQKIHLQNFSSFSLIMGLVAF